MFASPFRHAVRDPLTPLESIPVRVADLAVCALLAVVTVGLLVSAI